MDTTDYKYDIAFSFLSADEPIARELSARLSPRYRTFVYSEQQKELAGTDGEQFFHDLFGKHARLRMPVATTLMLQPGAEAVAMTPTESLPITTRKSASSARRKAVTYGKFLDFTTYVRPGLPSTQYDVDFSPIHYVT